MYQNATTNTRRIIMADKATGNEIVAGDMFELAAKWKIRFNYRGVLTVEDLFDISLEDLDAIFKSLNLRYKASKEESLLEVRSSEDKKLELQINLIKYIVQVKKALAAKRLAAAEKKQKRETLLALKADAENKALKEKSVEDINKMLADLDADDSEE